MAKITTATAATPAAQSIPVSRSRRLEAVLGRDWKIALLFTLPMLVIMVGLIFWPFVNAIMTSFTVRSIDRTDQFVGFANYVRLWRDASFRDTVSNTVVFTSSRWPASSS